MWDFVFHNMSQKNPEKIINAKVNTIKNCSYSAFKKYKKRPYTFPY